MRRPNSPCNRLCTGPGWANKPRLPRVPFSLLVCVPSSPHCFVQDSMWCHFSQGDVTQPGPHPTRAFSLWLQSSSSGPLCWKAGMLRNAIALRPLSHIQAKQNNSHFPFSDKAPELLGMVPSCPFSCSQASPGSGGCSSPYSSSLSCGIG